MEKVCTVTQIRLGEGGGGYHWGGGSANREPGSYIYIYVYIYIYNIYIYRSGSYAFTMRSLFRSSHTGWNRQRSQKETSTDDRLEAFHSQSLRKILHFKSTYYTEVLNPTARTYTNQEVRALTSQPPLTHHIHTSFSGTFFDPIRTT